MFLYTFTHHLTRFKSGTLTHVEVCLLHQEGYDINRVSGLILHQDYAESTKLILTEVG